MSSTDSETDCTGTGSHSGTGFFGCGLLPSDEPDVKNGTAFRFVMCGSLADNAGMTNLEMLRIADNLTVAGLSQKTGISEPRILELESGEHDMDPVEVMVFSRVFCIDPAQLQGQIKPVTRHDSAVCIGSWPLVSLGPDARGILAVGTKACGIVSIGLFSRGVISIGCFSMGGVSLGLFSLGLLSAGCFSLGLLTLGLFSLGVIAVGNIAAGIWSFGLLSLGVRCSAGLNPLGLHPVVLGGPAAVRNAAFQEIYEQTPQLLQPLTAMVMRLFS